MRKVLHDLTRVFLVELIILLVLVVLVILGYLYRKPLLISYHRLGQRSALKAMRRTEMQHDRFNHHSDRLRRHTDALIRLGYLEEGRFQLKFLTSRSPQIQVMIDEFRRIYPRSSYSIGLGKMLATTDRPERMPTWESLIRKYDVPPSDSNQPVPSKDPQKSN